MLPSRRERRMGRGRRHAQARQSAPPTSGAAPPAPVSEPAEAAAARQDSPGQAITPAAAAPRRRAEALPPPPPAVLDRPGPAPVAETAVGDAARAPVAALPLPLPTPPDDVRRPEAPPAAPTAVPETEAGPNALEWGEPRRGSNVPWALIVVAVLAATAIAVTLVRREHATGHRAAGSPSSALSASTSATPPAQGVLWHTLTLPGGLNPAASGAMVDPDGSLWLVAVTSAGPDLMRVATDGTVAGSWAIPGPAPVRLQTIGTDQVWLAAAGKREFSFDKATGAFESYAVQPAVAAATVAGYSVGLYVPTGAAGKVSGTPYALVAPLGAAKATHVALPGATADPRANLAAVLPGPGGDALIVAGTAVWTLAPAQASAAPWGQLPAAAVPSSVAWGAGELWFAATPAGATPVIEGMPPGGPAAPLKVTGTPAPTSTLAFSGGLLWWAGNTAVAAYDPSRGSAKAYPFPRSGAEAPLVQPAISGGAWAVQDASYALIQG